MKMLSAPLIKERMENSQFPTQQLLQSIEIAAPQMLKLAAGECIE